MDVADAVALDDLVDHRRFIGTASECLAQTDLYGIDAEQMGGVVHLPGVELPRPGQQMHDEFVCRTEAVVSR